MASQYDNHWKLLKQSPGTGVAAGIAVELSPPNLTDHQAAKAFNTLRKALQKRKLNDVAYNRANVGARLESDRRGLICRFWLVELTKVGKDDV